MRKLLSWFCGAYDKNESKHEFIEQPYREIPYWRGRFWFWLFIVPIAGAILLNWITAIFVFEQLSFKNQVVVSVVHLVILYTFLCLLWKPHFLAFQENKFKIEKRKIIVRNIALLVGLSLIFPHEVLKRILFSDHIDVAKYHLVYNLLFFLGLLMILITSIFHFNTTAAKDLSLAFLPRQRTNKRKMVWFEGFVIVSVLIGFLVIELWVLASQKSGIKVWPPKPQYAYEYFLTEIEKQINRNAEQDQQVRIENRSPSPRSISSIPNSSFHRLQIESRSTDKISINIWHIISAWFAAGLIIALWLFLTAGLGNRIMLPTLISVTFHEMDIKGILFRAPTYLKHLWGAILMKFHFLTIGGGVLVFSVLSTAVLLVWAENVDVMEKVFQPDGLVLMVGVFVAWFGQFLFSTVNIDETFGEYFNRYLASHLMQIQNHTVYVGYGNLGKRIVTRDLQTKTYSLVESPCATVSDNQISKIYHRLMKAKDDFFRPYRKSPFVEIISPDLGIEKLFTGAVIVEKSPRDLIFATENELLGRYGVVASLRRQYRSKAPGGSIVHAERRVLVPMILGEAREPFISSRVNLERARLIVSMVADTRGVQQVFDRAAQSKINAIIAVTGSDQIAYLTYRARSHNIVLVYPKHAQGDTLGYRLWAAILKVKSVLSASTTNKVNKNNNWPKVMIVGNNRGNFYMLETLWHLFPSAPHEKKTFFENNLRFLLAKEPGDVYPTPLIECYDQSNQNIFDKKLPFTFVTSARKTNDPDDIVQQVCIPAMDINAVDTSLIEQSFRAFEPHILIVNDDIPETTAHLLSRCIRTLERIKSVQPGFELPLLLLGASRGDQKEQLLLGDASRFYDSICRIHRSDIALDKSYPTHFYFDHFQKRIIGETFVDSLADTEEMIIAALQCMSNTNHLLAGKGAKEETGGPKAKKTQPDRNETNDPDLVGKFIEISACLINYPGVLANYIALLSGLRPKFDESAMHSYLPTFDYLRNVKLDPQGKGFAISGFARLIKIDDSKMTRWIQNKKEDDTDIDANADYVARVFANDGRKYIEEKLDPIEGYDEETIKRLEAWYKNYYEFLDREEGQTKGVLAVLRRLMGQNLRNQSKEFQNFLLNDRRKAQRMSKQVAQESTIVCPGMSSCRIAALQDYIAASNSKRFPQNPIPAPVQVMGKANEFRQLWHAKNYCCKDLSDLDLHPLNELEKHPARIFVCSHAKPGAGNLARVLNALIFRSVESSTPEGGSWAINIDYFKDISCHNSLFSLNRLFGHFEELPENDHRQPLPIQLIRILPVGDIQSFEAWFDYAKELCQYLNELEASGRKDNSKISFFMYWRNAENQRYFVKGFSASEHEPQKTSPSWGNGRSNFPVVIVIKRYLMEQQYNEDKKDNKQQVEMCEICQRQSNRFDCQRLRLWI